MDDNGDLIIVATPWGTRSSAEKAIEEISSFFLAAKDDQEITSPFDILTCLSVPENHLRTSVLFANQAIYKEENLAEYTTGTELFVCAKQDDFFFWSQVGNPSIILKRKGRPLIALGGTSDLSLDYSFEQNLSPLPSELLGIEPTLNVRYHNLIIHPEDRILLLSHSSLEQPVLLLDNPTIDEVSRTLAQMDADQPHWVAEINF
ncbi:MAG: hypothetical protein R2827_11605 [Bdellovibrionales bacterium]